MKMITIVLPIALLYAYDVIHTMRYVKCRVECIECKVIRNEGSPYVRLADIESIDINRIVKSEVCEWKLVDLTHSAQIRKVLLFTGAYGLYDAGYLSVAEAGLTYVNTVTGEVTNARIFHPLVSHSAQRRVYFHGYWDYTGDWHEGETDVPAMEPFITEMHSITDGAYFSDTACAQLLSNVNVTAGTIVPLTPATARNTTLALPWNLCSDAAKIAAAQLCNRGMLEHGAAYDVRQEGTHLQAAYNLTQVAISDYDTAQTETVQMQLTPRIRRISANLWNAPQLFGLEQTMLSSYSINCANMEYFALPRALTTSVYNTNASLVLDAKRAKDGIADTLDLASICYDMTMVNIRVGGQPWRNVALPTAQMYTVYKSDVTLPEVNCVVLPSRTWTGVKDECAAQTMLELHFVKQDGVLRQGNVNLRALNNWKEIDIIARIPRAYRAAVYDGTKNVMNVAVGITKCATAHCKYTTDAAITDNINIVKIPTFECTVAEDTPSDARVIAGVMHIKGEIDKLTFMLPVNMKPSSVVKHIYIDGVVNELQLLVQKPREACWLDRLAQGMQVEEQMLRKRALTRIMLHIRKGIALPKIIGTSTDVNWLFKLTTAKDDTKARRDYIGENILVLTKEEVMSMIVYD